MITPGPAPSRLPVTVSAHVHADTTVRVTLHPADDRAVVILEGRIGGTDVALFLDRPDLARWRGVLGVTITTLDAQHAAYLREHDAGDADGPAGSAA